MGNIQRTDYAMDNRQRTDNTMGNRRTDIAMGNRQKIKGQTIQWAVDKR
jgi:hypothetical protein